RSATYIYATGLAKVMAGEASCLYAPWLRANFKDYKASTPDPSLARWVAEHTRLVRSLASAHQAVGELVFTESQNYFQLALRDGVLLAGKPDLVTIEPSGLVTVREAKTGKPQTSHLLQTMIYMYALPLALPRYSGQKLTGRVIYKNGDEVPIPSDAI